MDEAAECAWFCQGWNLYALLSPLYRYFYVLWPCFKSLVIIEVHILLNLFH